MEVRKLIILISGIVVALAAIGGIFTFVFCRKKLGK